MLVQRREVALPPAYDIIKMSKARNPLATAVAGLRDLSPPERLFSLLLAGRPSRDSVATLSQILADVLEQPDDFRHHSVELTVPHMRKVRDVPEAVNLLKALGYEIRPVFTCESGWVESGIAVISEANAKSNASEIRAVHALCLRHLNDIPERANNGTADGSDRSGSLVKSNTSSPADVEDGKVSTVSLPMNSNLSAASTEFPSLPSLGRSIKQRERQVQGTESSPPGNPGPGVLEGGPGPGPSLTHTCREPAGLSSHALVGQAQAGAGSDADTAEAVGAGAGVGTVVAGARARTSEGTGARGGKAAGVAARAGPSSGGVASVAPRAAAGSDGDIPGPGMPNGVSDGEAPAGARGGSPNGHCLNDNMDIGASSGAAAGAGYYGATAAGDSSDRGGTGGVPIGGAGYASRSNNRGATFSQRAGNACGSSEAGGIEQQGTVAGASSDAGASMIHFDEAMRSPGWGRIHTELFRDYLAGQVSGDARARLDAALAAAEQAGKQPGLPEFVEALGRSRCIDLVDASGRDAHFTQAVSEAFSKYLAEFMHNQLQQTGTPSQHYHSQPGPPGELPSHPPPESLHPKGQPALTLTPGTAAPGPAPVAAPSAGQLGVPSIARLTAPIPAAHLALSREPGEAIMTGAGPGVAPYAAPAPAPAVAAPRLAMTTAGTSAAPAATAAPAVATAAPVAHTATELSSSPAGATRAPAGMTEAPAAALAPAVTPGSSAPSPAMGAVAEAAPGVAQAQASAGGAVAGTAGMPAAQHLPGMPAAQHLSGALASQPTSGSPASQPQQPPPDPLRAQHPGLWQAFRMRSFHKYLTKRLAGRAKAQLDTMDPSQSLNQYFKLDEYVRMLGKEVAEKEWEAFNADSKQQTTLRSGFPVFYARVAAARSAQAATADANANGMQPRPQQGGGGAAMTMPAGVASMTPRAGTATPLPPATGHHHEHGVSLPALAAAPAPAPAHVHAHANPCVPAHTPAAGHAPTHGPPPPNSAPLIASNGKAMPAAQQPPHDQGTSWAVGSCSSLHPQPPPGANAPPAIQQRAGSTSPPRPYPGGSPHRMQAGAKGASSPPGSTSSQGAVALSPSHQSGLDSLALPSQSNALLLPQSLSQEAPPFQPAPSLQQAPSFHQAPMVSSQPPAWARPSSPPAHTHQPNGGQVPLMGQNVAHGGVHGGRNNEQGGHSFAHDPHPDAPGHLAPQGGRGRANKDGHGGQVAALGVSSFPQLTPAQRQQLAQYLRSRQAAALAAGVGGGLPGQGGDCLAPAPTERPPFGAVAPPEWAGDDHERPPMWAPMDASLLFECVPLSARSVEFLFWCSRMEMFGLDVTGIQRIQNPRLWRKYVTERSSMLHDKVLATSSPHALMLPPYDLHESLLYHCSKQPDHTKICGEGLDHRLSNTGTFGRGIYLTDDPRKAVIYSGNTGKLYICAALLGDALAVPSRHDHCEWRREPEKVPEDRRTCDDVRFDSVIGRRASTGGGTGANEFVLYRQNATCPMYMVEFTGASSARSVPTPTALCSVPDFTWKSEAFLQHNAAAGAAGSAAGSNSGGTGDGSRWDLFLKSFYQAVVPAPNEPLRDTATSEVLGDDAVMHDDELTREGLVREAGGAGQGGAAVAGGVRGHGGVMGVGGARGDDSRERYEEGDSRRAEGLRRGDGSRHGVRGCEVSVNMVPTGENGPRHAREYSLRNPPWAPGADAGTVNVNDSLLPGPVHPPTGHRTVVHSGSGVGGGSSSGGGTLGIHGGHASGSGRGGVGNIGSHGDSGVHMALAPRESASREGYRDAPAAGGAAPSGGIPDKNISYSDLFNKPSSGQTGGGDAAAAAAAAAFPAAVPGARSSLARPATGLTPAALQHRAGHQPTGYPPAGHHYGSGAPGTCQDAGGDAQASKSHRGGHSHGAGSAGADEHHATHQATGAAHGAVHAFDKDRGAHADNNIISHPAAAAIANHAAARPLSSPGSSPIRASPASDSSCPGSSRKMGESTGRLEHLTSHNRAGNTAQVMHSGQCTALSNGQTLAAGQDVAIAGGGQPMAPGMPGGQHGNAACAHGNETGAHGGNARPQPAVSLASVTGGAVVGGSSGRGHATSASSASGSNSNSSAGHPGSAGRHPGTAGPHGNPPHGGGSGGHGHVPSGSPVGAHGRDVCAGPGVAGWSAPATAHSTNHAPPPQQQDLYPGASGGGHPGGEGHPSAGGHPTGGGQEKHLDQPLQSVASAHGNATASHTFCLSPQAPGQSPVPVVSQLGLNGGLIIQPFGTTAPGMSVIVQGMPSLGVALQGHQAHQGSQGNQGLHVTVPSSGLLASVPLQAPGVSIPGGAIVLAPPHGMTTPGIVVGGTMVAAPGVVTTTTTTTNSTTTTEEGGAPGGCAGGVMPGVSSHQQREQTGVGGVSVGALAPLVTSRRQEPTAMCVRPDICVRQSEQPQEQPQEQKGEQKRERAGGDVLGGKRKDRGDAVTDDGGRAGSVRPRVQEEDSNAGARVGGLGHPHVHHSGSVTVTVTQVTISETMEDDRVDGAGNAGGVIGNAGGACPRVVCSEVRDAGIEGAEPGTNFVQRALEAAPAGQAPLAALPPVARPAVILHPIGTGVVPAVAGGGGSRISGHGGARAMASSPSSPGVVMTSCIEREAADDDVTGHPEGLTCRVCLDVVGVGEPCLAMPCGHVNGHADCCRPLIQTRVMADGVTSQTFTRCEVCTQRFGVTVGKQPLSAQMSHQVVPGLTLAGHPPGAIVISYEVPSGIQDADGDAPGKPFRGTNRRAYLPDSPEGREVLRLLQRAFQQRLIFSVGKSDTTGQDNVVKWGSIHHKTNPKPGGPYGYPDAGYMMNVMDEMAQRGVVL
eukprot:jgi/Mesvir1/15786/Mv03352-RA.1